MDRKDWLALCAVHSDAWLMSLIFFYAARFDADGRAELFSLVNQHPTVYEVVTGRVARNKMYKRKLPRPAGPTPAQQAAAAASAAAMAAFEEPNPFVRPGYQAADQVWLWQGVAGWFETAVDRDVCLQRVEHMHQGRASLFRGQKECVPHNCNFLPASPAAATAHGPAAHRGRCVACAVGSPG